MSSTNPTDELMKTSAMWASQEVIRQIDATMLSVASKMEARINEASARSEAKFAASLLTLNKRIYALEHAAALPQNPVAQWLIFSLILLVVFLAGARTAWLYIGQLVRNGQPFPSTVATIQIGVAAAVFILMVALVALYCKVPKGERSWSDFLVVIFAAVVVLYGLAILGGLGSRWPILLAPLAFL